MIAEGLGVNYGLIFGHYNYGDALGMKIYGVPWLIGANWSILTLCCGAIATDLTEAFFSRVLLGVGLMLLLDFVIEPIAPILDFWEFDNGIAPMQNYLGWFAIALPLHFLYQKLNVQIKGNFTTIYIYYRLYFSRYFCYNLTHCKMRFSFIVFFLLSVACGSSTTDEDQKTNAIDPIPLNLGSVSVYQLTKHPYQILFFFRLKHFLNTIKK